MAFQYNAKDASDCWPAGEYQAVIVKVEETISKSSGEPMQVISYEIYGNDGRTQTLKDYITHKTLFKLKKLAQALGRRAEFEASRFNAEDHVGASVVVELSVEETEDYGDQNRIKKVLSAKGGQTPNQSGSSAPPSNPPPPPKKSGSAGDPHKPVDESDIPF